jgi:hypothetical protein
MIEKQIKNNGITLNVSRNGIGYGGTYLDEAIIKTEEYTQFDKTFWYQTSLLEDLGYKVVNKGNNPFRETEEYRYYFENNNKINDYVFVSKNHRNNYSIIIGIHLDRNRPEETSLDLIKSIVKYQDLRNQIAEIFKERYEKKDD